MNLFLIIEKLLLQNMDTYRNYHRNYHRIHDKNNNYVIIIIYDNKIIFLYFMSNSKNNLVKSVNTKKTIGYTNTNTTTNTIIYILCYNQEIFDEYSIQYKKYKWAKPIVMKYQDYTFENAFWRQLSEIEDEWIHCDMVGVLAYSAYKKIKLDIVDKIIMNKLYFPNNYYHFLDNTRLTPSISTIRSHPLFSVIWNDVLLKLNLFTITESYCNYWMCKPVQMKLFIKWYNDICLPVLINTTHMFDDAKYRSNLDSSKLIQLWGKPYYPYLPFVSERLNKAFFIKNHKIVFLISHENSNTGAPNALYNMKQIYDDHNIKTILLYLTDINDKNVDIIKYIAETSEQCNCSPVVICNTLYCFPIIQKLKEFNILTYWYIHEWYEPPQYNNFIKDYLYLFHSNIYILFICNRQYQQYKKLIPKIKNTILLCNSDKILLLENTFNKQLTENKSYDKILNNYEADKLKNDHLSLLSRPLFTYLNNSILANWLKINN